MKTAIVVLAAGEGSRMGTAKQTILVHGKPMIINTLDQVLDVEAFPVVVVLGAHKTAVFPYLSGMPITVVENNEYSSGMASSLIKGLVGAYMTFKDIDAILYVPVDLPGLKAEVLNLLIQTAKENPDVQVVASKYSESEFGLPTLFKRAVFEEILDLEGDLGAKKIIKKHPAVFVDFPEGAHDLDTPEDLQKFLGLN